MHKYFLFALIPLLCCFSCAASFSDNPYTPVPDSLNPNVPPTPGEIYGNSIRTYTSEDWDYWESNLEALPGKFRTYTSNDWDYWEYTPSNGGSTVKIRTYTSEDWDYWEITDNTGKITLRTYTSEDWDYWETSTGLKIRTFTSEDWDYWECGNIKVRTYTSEDWDHWEVSGNLSQHALKERIAIVFVPIFTSVRLNVTL